MGLELYKQVKLRCHLTQHKPSMELVSGDCYDFTVSFHVLELATYTKQEANTFR